MHFTVSGSTAPWPPPLPFAPPSSSSKVLRRLCEPHNFQGRSCIKASACSEAIVAGDNNEEDDDDEEDDEDDDASFNFFDSGLAPVAAVPTGADADAAPPSKAREAR